MERTVNLYLRGMELGKPQIHEAMVLFPITSGLDQGPDYITLSEALETGLFEVTEVGPGGAVPELKAINRGEKPVLLLDGEELWGAKQNRVLNTTILVGPKTSVVIPVSCVEAHRWHGPSLHMQKSDHLMNCLLRREKINQVHFHLERERAYITDQDKIWNDIDLMAARFDVDSPTAAMSDIYEAKKKDLEDYLRAFQLTPGQKGLMVFIEARPVGLEFVSRDTAFSRLYQKLLKSYVLEAIGLKYEKQTGKKPRRQKEKNPETGSPVSSDLARAFIEEASRCEEKRFQSVGLGVSCRYLSNSIIGAALEVDGAVLHLVFFSVDGGQDRERPSRPDENFPRLRIRKNYLFEEK
ncbi:MAG: hypothetical protein QME85_01360 [Candidatus Saccharicenans sp.]|nr:hypothetical protein [Candidatus Saccharicenans sp.]